MAVGLFGEDEKMFGIIGTGLTVFFVLALMLCFAKFFFGAFFWIVIKLPLTIIFFALGVVFCCTIILIPLGLLCFKIAGGMLVPCT